MVPVYNTEEYLPACLDSVLTPVPGDCEIVVVNDGSTDGSLAVAEDYARRYPGLVRVISTENGGLGAARNVGLAAARGEFLLFLDSDDSLAPGALGEMLDACTEDRDLILFDLVSVNPDGSVIETLPGSKKQGARSLADDPALLLEYPSACNKLCRRSLFLDSGLRFPGRVWYEDLRTMPKLYLHTARIWACARPWYRYLLRPGSITNSAQLKRNLEILDAVDDLCAYYRAAGAYEACRAELDYLVFYNLFLTASVRVCLGDAKSPVLPQLRAALLERVPDWAENPYVRALPLKHRLLTKLLMAGQYPAVAALMRLNDRRKHKNR